MTDTDQEKRLSEILKELPPERAANLIKLIIGMVWSELRSIVVPETLDTIRDQLGHSDVVLRAVEELTEKTTDSREDVLLKALSLYDAAIEAKKRNQRLVLVGPDYQFIREIVGFDRTKQESQPYAEAVR
jgi:hypothetical protein